LLVVGLSGCRQAGRLAWAADARSFSPLAWPARLTGQETNFLRQQEGLAHYMVGVLAEASGDMKTAQRRYTQARAYHPKIVQVLLRLGAVYLRTNDLDKAIQTFEAASQLDPTDPRSRFLLGILYANEKRFEEAAAQYAEVLTQDPSNLGALSYLADLYVLQEKLQEGLVVYEQLLQERPHSAPIHFNIGVLYAKVEQWEDAVEHMTKAVEINPNYLEARLGLAVGLELSGHLEDAREEFHKALALEPVNTQLIHYLGRISFRIGDLKAAEEWFTRYLSFKPKDLAAHLEVALLQIEQGRWEDAVGQIESALDVSAPQEPPAELFTALGLAHQTGKQYKKAEEAYQRAVQAAPKELKPYLYLGALYHRTERFADAEQAYLQAEEIDPSDPDLLNSLGYLYADQGIHLERAVTLIERALSHDPRSGAYLDSLAWAYFRMGRLEEALKLLKEATEALEDSEIFAHLGHVYLSLGDRRQAQAAWEKALELGPETPELRKRLERQLKMLKRGKLNRKRIPGNPRKD